MYETVARAVGPVSNSPISAIEDHLVSLTGQLNDRACPIAHYLRARLPYTGDLQRRYRESIAHAAPLTPENGAEVASGTIGDALNWRLRFLLTPQPNLTLAFLGAVRLSQARHRFVEELLGVVGGRLPLPPGSGRREADPPPPADTPRLTRLKEERLVRCCFALALYTEVYRAGPRPGSRLLTLRRTATLEDLLALANEAEVADILALTEVARRVLLPTLDARGTPRYLGPNFTGSPDVGHADADIIAGGLLLECKTTMGRPRRDGRRYCSLELTTLHQLLGYLLLDYHDEYAIDTLGIYAARYAYLVTWSTAELLAELAGGPVDLAELRAGFEEAAKRTAHGRVGVPQSPGGTRRRRSAGSRDRPTHRQSKPSGKDDRGERRGRRQRPARDSTADPDPQAGREGGSLS
jgi:hypothetical protein